MVTNRKDMIALVTKQFGKAEATRVLGHLSRFSCATAWSSYSDNKMDIRKTGKNEYSITELENTVKF